MVNAIHQNSIPELVGGTPAGTSPQTQAVSPSLMPDANVQSFSGDPGAELAALATKTGNEERTAARTSEDNDMRAEEGCEQAEVQDMHDKADLQRAQGFVDGAIQIGQGACDLAAGINDAKAVTATGNDQQADKLRSAWSRSGGALLGASEKMLDGVLAGAITDKDADAKAREASATAFKQMADDAHASENGAADFVSKVADFYKEYVDTKAQTAMAAIRRA